MFVSREGSLPAPRFSITTLSIMTLSIKGLLVTIICAGSNVFMLNVVMLSIVAPPAHPKSGAPFEKAPALLTNVTPSWKDF
jgi:hypothetical protein